ncbi:MAG: hypothetical protein Q8O26_02140 [Phreatobacter sp.]|uniref:hypothetical protein n=1 Tax=Phreatobacter sp. TaxID=1966341 RepID=UPI002734227A|nr:hypothetical protein [Phreatobacter sp.]MDP2800660.1 hypothetical protein [Phreatobacter sp.]
MTGRRGVAAGTLSDPANLPRAIVGADAALYAARAAGRNRVQPVRQAHAGRAHVAKAIPDAVRA